MNELTSLLEPLTELAEDAGRRIMEFYRTDCRIEKKADMSPVTQADFAANEAILAGLDILAPGIPIISEEIEIPEYETRKHWKTYWLVDPLDGTREFINHREGFSVNIALIENHKPVASVIHAPVSGASYFASKGDGAFKKTPEHEIPVQIHAQKHCRDIPVIAASRSRHGERFTRLLHLIGEHQTIYRGSSLKSCMVAEGVADFYPCLGPTSEWDTAAAQCIVEEAGGKLTDTNLQPLQYNTKESILNPQFIVFGDQHKNWKQYLQP